MMLLTGRAEMKTTPGFYLPVVNTNSALGEILEGGHSLNRALELRALQL